MFISLLVNAYHSTITLLVNASHHSLLFPMTWHSFLFPMTWHSFLFHTTWHYHPLMPRNVYPVGERLPSCHALCEWLSLHTFYVGPPFIYDPTTCRDYHSLQTQPHARKISMHEFTLCECLQTQPHCVSACRHSCIVWAFADTAVCMNLQTATSVFKRSTSLSNSTALGNRYVDRFYYVPASIPVYCMQMKSCNKMLFKSYWY